MTIDRPGPRYSDFFRRLRARPVSSWAVAGRVAAARSTAERLAELGWAHEQHDGRQAPPVPDLGWHALADQLEVLLDDADRAGVDAGLLGTLMTELAEKLSVRLD